LLWTSFMSSPGRTIMTSGTASTCELRAAHEKQAESRNADDREDVRINSAKRNPYAYMQ
jgi:hypothetical protein